MGIGIPATTEVNTASRNFASLKREVVAFVLGDQEDDDLNEAAGFALNAAIDEINLQNWLSYIKQQDFTLVAGTISYALNSDVKRPREMMLLDSDGDLVGILPNKSRKTLNIEHPYAKENSTPEAYALDLKLRLMELSCPPSAGYIDSYPTLRLKYHQLQPRMTGPEDILVYPPVFEQFLLWHAKWQLAISEDPRKAAMAYTQRNRLWKMLIRDDRDSTTDWSTFDES